jgi:hypothetical protein
METYTRGYHLHRCPRCKHIWKHLDGHRAIGRNNEEAHSCPSCGHFSEDCYYKHIEFSHRLDALEPTEPDSFRRKAA